MASPTLPRPTASAAGSRLRRDSPLARGLFQRAILQSAAPGAPRTAAHSDAMGNELLARLKLPQGAAGLAALRALPADKINAAAQHLTVAPGVDPSYHFCG